MGLDGWVMGDTPWTVMTTRAPAVLKMVTKKQTKNLGVHPPLFRSFFLNVTIFLASQM